MRSVFAARHRTIVRLIKTRSTRERDTPTTDLGAESDGAWEWTRALWGGRLTRNAKRWRKSVFCCFRCCRYCDCVCQYVLLVEWLSQQTRTSSLTMSTWLCQDTSSHYGHTNILIHPSVVLTTRHGVLRRALTLLLYALFSAVLNRICFSTLLS